MVVTIHDHIAELRRLLGELEGSLEALPIPDDAPITLALAAMGLGNDVLELETELLALEQAAKPVAIAEKAPALESWRRAVLEKPAAYSKRDQAAAWELTALEAQRTGNLHAAERAKREAGFALGIRGAA